MRPLDNPTQAELQEAEAPTEPDIVIGSREQIFHLLAEAAEIEHTLMCSYLYAAFSLKDDFGPTAPQSEADATKRWRKAIMSVAFEEMGHLMIVSNLFAALGGRPHFARPNFPVSAGYFPSGVVLRLTAFSFETLDHFIFLERPTGLEQPDAKGFEAVEHKREQAHIGLMPSAQDYETVSHLYEAIRANLKAFVARSGAKSLFIGAEGGQIDPAMISISGGEIITDLASADRAIDLIVEQGEGSSADREDSHYRRFQRIKEEYTELLAQNPAFEPAYPVAQNPVMRRAADSEGKVFIDAEPAAMVLDLANAVYGLLLRFLVQSYAFSATGEGRKQQLLSAAIELMHVLDKTAKILCKLPASDSQPNTNAGMTFTMLRGVEPFSGGVAEKTLLLERLQQLATGAAKVSATVPAVNESARILQGLAEQYAAT